MKPKASKKLSSSASWRTGADSSRHVAAGAGYRCRRPQITIPLANASIVAEPISDGDRNQTGFRYRLRLTDVTARHSGPVVFSVPRGCRASAIPGASFLAGISPFVCW